MLDFRKTSWVEGTDPTPTGKYSTLAFSQTNIFHMRPAPQKHLAIALAAFGKSCTNLMRIASSGHEIDVTDEGSLTVMLPSRGSIEVTVDGKNHWAPADGVLSFGPSQRRTRVAGTDTGDFEAYLLKTPIAVLDFPKPGTEGATFETRDPFIPASIDTARALSSLSSYVFANLESAEPFLLSEKASALAEVLFHEHVRLLVESALEPDDALSPVSVTKIRQAEEFMRAHFAEPLRVADIASAVGLGTRSLEATFRRTAGSTPRAALTSIRLEHARRRLLTSGEADSVTLIALECGFAHLGRFAQLYKKAYGELPSETLRRHRNLN